MDSLVNTETTVRHHLPEMIRMVKLRQQTEGTSYFLIEWQGSGADPLLGKAVRERIDIMAHKDLGDFYEGLEFKRGSLKLMVRIGTSREICEQWIRFCRKLKTFSV